jgi:hypothetical protein
MRIDYTPIQEAIEEVTDKPWFSWPAHLDLRKMAVYWGSDFICDVRVDDTAEKVRAKLEDYIENKMRVKTW